LLFKLLTGVSGKVPTAMLQAAVAAAEAPAAPRTSLNLQQPGANDQGLQKLVGMQSELAQIGFGSGSKRSQGSERQGMQQRQKQKQANGMASMVATDGEAAVHQSRPVVQLPFNQLLSWLQLLGRTANGSLPSFVAALVQELLQQSMLFDLLRKQSWQLYQLLLQLQQQPAWQQQGLTGLTAGACDALIQQQREPAWYGTAAGSVLQLL
jgi:hypothetical protein